MKNNKKIEKRLENDLGFETCKVNPPQNKIQGEFKAECQNSYEDMFSCQGKISKDGVLTKTNCDKEE
ncbi:MAG: hypothetical protein EU531_09950 [Promethearchaeota archaeon]|nr:MAG: hypothetical protein EU531_09950 [Candidatus Lokiarchaeota archaeon]